MLRVLFDVDDTLIHLPLHSDKDEPNMPMIELLKALSAAGHEVYVSSGGGVEYAKNWCKKLFWNPKIFIKKSRIKVNINTCLYIFFIKYHFWRYLFN